SSSERSRTADMMRNPFGWWLVGTRPRCAQRPATPYSSVRVAVGGEPFFGRELEIAAQSGADAQEVRRGGAAVDAQGVRPRLEPVRDGGERAGQPLARRTAGHGAHEVLVGDGQQ